MFKNIRKRIRRAWTALAGVGVDPAEYKDIIESVVGSVLATLLTLRERDITSLDRKRQAGIYEGVVAWASAHAAALTMEAKRLEAPETTTSQPSE